MANPAKGEVAFEAEGRTFKFVLGTWARAVLQHKVGKLDAFFSRWEEWGDDEVLKVFHAGLQRHHEDVTEKEAADLIDELGPDRVAKVFMDAVLLSTPEAARGSDRPRKAARKNGAGKSSMGRGAAI